MKNYTGIIVKNKQKRIENENSLTPKSMIFEQPQKPYKSIVDCDLVICMPSHQSLRC